MKWIKTVSKKVSSFFRRIYQKTKPSGFALVGVKYSFIVLAALQVIWLFISSLLPDLWPGLVASIIVFVALFILVGWLSVLALKLINSIHATLRNTILVVTPISIFMLMPAAGAKGGIILLVTLMLIVGLLGGVLAILINQGVKGILHWKSYLAMGLCVSLITGLSITLWGEKDSLNPLLDEYQLVNKTLELPNPGEKGNYQVNFLTYGSGNDKRREEYASQVDIKTDSVDGSKLIDNWDGFGGWIRTQYWGFDSKELPVQARVWYPEGEGEFPLVLIVHGNHSMEDFSDPGYQYLGELFASRGYIFASVDENFLNSSFSDLTDITKRGLEGENDARGWLLLKHLEQWRSWNEDEEHLFAGRVDIDKVVLIGHSRGGEAVATAAVFNQLSHYPDDASVSFDFGFNLRGVVAIAPVDGQYKPRGLRNLLVDTNYLTIHGSMDGDVTSFMGLSVYERAKFTSRDFRFKSSLYIYGANHGQFNSSWGDCDNPPVWCWSLDKTLLMPEADQRKVAQVMIGAFLETTIKENARYLPVLSDPSYAADWLPNTYYIANYADNKTEWIADYEEDLNVSSGSSKAITISSKNLTRWSESWVQLKWRELDTHAVLIAWDEEVYQDTASYSFTINNETKSLTDQTQLVFSLAPATGGTKPKGWQTPEEENNQSEQLANINNTQSDSSTANNDESDTSKLGGKDKKPTTLDFTIKLTDSNGHSATLALSYNQALYPRVKSKTRLTEFMTEDNLSEIVFRRYQFSIHDFLERNGQLDANLISEISLVFDKSKQGAILLDDVGLIY